ncbi:MAG: hypothetical protein N3F07_02835 [Candidatus Micrarchaeota archaeon]|nr:hypothetical protein [Candidatus Micrarchaeota archaeon]
MACFIVPTIVGIGAHLMRKKIPREWRAEWLVAMVLGGAAGLTVEHIASGEIVPWPPFFTAMASPESFAAMLEEMLLVGIPMSIAIVAAWAAIVHAHNNSYFRKKFQLPAPNEVL